MRVSTAWAYPSALAQKPAHTRPHEALTVEACMGQPWSAQPRRERAFRHKLSILGGLMWLWKNCFYDFILSSRDGCRTCQRWLLGLVPWLCWLLLHGVRSPWRCCRPFDPEVQSWAYGKQQHARLLLRQRLPASLQRQEPIPSDTTPSV